MLTTTKLRTPQDFLNLVRGVKQQGRDNWMSLCPHHTDTNQSLSIKFDGGKLLLRCFAGCDTADILTDLDLTFADLNLNHNWQDASLKQIASFSYRGFDGNEIYQIRRYEPKQFLIWRLVNGEYVSGLGGIKPVLYHLDLIPKWIKRGKTIYTPEGESKADKLIEMGFAATSSPFGAGKGKWHEDYSEVLKGADVIVLPDNDIVGRHFAEEKVKSLEGKAKSVRVLELPGLPEKGDIIDWLASGGTAEWLKTLSEEAIPPEEIAETNEILSPFTEANGKVFLQVEKPDGRMVFACLEGAQVKFINEVELAKERKVKPRPLPRANDGTVLTLVGLPDTGIAEVQPLKPAELLTAIKTHISKYADLNELDLQLVTYYAIFTWFYHKVKTLGYLRFIADTGKGKSRIEQVVSDLSFYPFRTDGASSFSGMARTSQRWKGTMVVDEADITGDMANQIIKFMNLGFEYGHFYTLSDKQNPKIQDYFDPYMPKILAMRKPFEDNATEGRLLSVSTFETQRKDIPIILPLDYYAEMQKLRNTIARFVMENWDKVDGTKMTDFSHLPVEARLRQLAMPLSIIFQLWPDGTKELENYLLARQQELRRGRSQSWEGSLFNTLLSIASGDTDLGASFPDYYEGGKIQAVTPSMVAREAGGKTSARSVTQGLTSIGFVVENHRLSSGKKTRLYSVPDIRTWEEMVSRYFYSDTGGTMTGIPEILKSSKYSVLGNVPSVPEAVEQPTGTDGTDGTLPGTRVIPEALPLETKQASEFPPYPTEPCSCGCSDYWLREENPWGKAEWLCTCCHPEPEGGNEQ